MGRILAWLDECDTTTTKDSARRRVCRILPIRHPCRFSRWRRTGSILAIPFSTPLEAKVPRRAYFQFLPHENVPRVDRERIAPVVRCVLLSQGATKFSATTNRNGVRTSIRRCSGMNCPEKHPWTQCLIASAGAVLQRPVVVSAAQYPCDAFLLQQKFGIPTLMFGPVWRWRASAQRRRMRSNRIRDSNR